MFDDRGQLASFSTRQDRLTIKTTSHATIIVGVDGMSMYELHPERLLSVVTGIGVLLGVESASLTAAFQHVLSWEGELTAEQACQQGAITVVPNAEAIGAYDFALLLDGKVPGWKYQVEFGVISPAEAPERLMRDLGRIPVVVGTVEAGDFSETTFPEVATFVDSNWTLNNDRPCAITSVDEQVDAAMTQANSLAEALHKQLRSATV